MKRLDHNGQHFYESKDGRFVEFKNVEVLLAELNLLRGEKLRRDSSPPLAWKEEPCETCGKTIMLKLTSVP
jgi:hypothetical protein